ncbi:splicing factor 3b subunit 4 [Botrytis cinerea]
MAQRRSAREQDKEATVYIGNIDERVTDSLVWELMLQAGRIVNVHLPKDRVTQNHQGYGFVEFISEEDAEYAARIMNQVRLFGKPIRVNKASADKQKTVEVGAELFIGNLDPMVDEKTLYDTFSRFGSLISPPKIARDESSLSKGYGFVSYANFEASDDAIANMNGQYLMNKDISVQYAYKKDGKGERHGDAAERALAAQAKKHNVIPDLQNMPPGLLLGMNGIPQAPAAIPPPSQAGYGGPQMDFHNQHAPPTGPGGAYGHPTTGPARGIQFPPGFAPPGGIPAPGQPGMVPPPGLLNMQAPPGFGGAQGMPMGMPPAGPQGHGDKVMEGGEENSRDMSRFPILKREVQSCKNWDCRIFKKHLEADILREGEKQHPKAESVIHRRKEGYIRAGVHNGVPKAK